MILPASSPKKLRFVSENRLVLYGVAAGAALAGGVSPAEADLITLDLTGLSSASRTTPAFGSLYFDVNAASAAAAVSFAPFTGADFRLTNSFPFTSIAGLAGTNAVVADSIEFGPKAKPMSGSNYVSGGLQFASSAKVSGPFPLAFFPVGSTGYLGLRFDIGTDTHYGWANISVNPDSTVSLNRLGYESDAGVAAHVPRAAVPEQGSSLLLLALGAVGIAGFRSLQRKAA